MSLPTDLDVIIPDDDDDEEFRNVLIRSITQWTCQLFLQAGLLDTRDRLEILHFVNGVMSHLETLSFASLVRLFSSSLDDEDEPYWLAFIVRAFNRQ